MTKQWQSSADSPCPYCKGTDGKCWSIKTGLYVSSFCNSDNTTKRKKTNEDPKR